MVLKSQMTPHLGLAKSPSMMVPIIPRSPTKLIKGIGLTRSISVPGEEECDDDDNDNDNDDDDNTNNDIKSDSQKMAKSNTNDNVVKQIASNGTNAGGGSGGSKVAIPIVDDEMFSKFFTTKIQKTVIAEGVEIGDFDAIKATEK